jgi:hypothetical protein
MQEQITGMITYDWPTRKIVLLDVIIVIRPQEALGDIASSLLYLDNGLPPSRV